MHNAIKVTPQSYSLLHVQTDFLRSKGKLEWAQKLAKEAVNCAPSEFSTWAKLTECFIDKDQWESALYTLNSCPMFTYSERDLHRMPAPARTHLPVKAFIAESGLLDDESARDNEADVALLRLPAPALRGTFAKAYGLLTKLVAKIGWDELLKCRSSVFVMEEEYRAQKTTTSEVNLDQGQTTDDDAASTTAIAPSIALQEGEFGGDAPADSDGNEGEKKGEQEEEQVRSVDSAFPSSSGDGEETSESDGLHEKLDSLGISSQANASSQSIPTIKVSTESDREREKSQLEEFVKQQQEQEHEHINGAAAAQSGPTPEVKVEAPPLEKPAQAQAGGGHGRTDSTATAGAGAAALADQSGKINGIAEGDSSVQSQPGPATSSGSAFNNKRLCERWLDNLFMVLYEVGPHSSFLPLKERAADQVSSQDLRVYTIWRAEVAHYKAQSLPYRKTGTEWEILGELALRLQHKEEAKDAFQRCVDAKFSAKAYLKLLEIYSEQRDVERSLWTAIRLTAYHHRWYMEGTVSSLCYVLSLSLQCELSRLTLFHPVPWRRRPPPLQPHRRRGSGKGQLYPRLDEPAGAHLAADEKLLCLCPGLQGAGLGVVVGKKSLFCHAAALQCHVERMMIIRKGQANFYHDTDGNALHGGGGTR